MIRFLPDTWREALMRPLAMAAPNNGVYVEISAPDLRFAAVLMLALLLLVWLRPKRLQSSPLLAVSLWSMAAFAVWLATTGNGRYIMPLLLVIGPICIALVARIPGTLALRISVAFGLLLGQGWVLYNNDPWGWWGLGRWTQAPYFDVQLDKRASSEPATYITIANISYSLIAPQFPPQARWANISSLPDLDSAGEAGRRMKSLLEASEHLQLLVPTRPDHMTQDKLPSPALRVVINDILAAQRLALSEPLNCRLLPSRALARTAVRSLDLLSSESLSKFGFWVCDLRYPVSAPKPKEGGDPQVLSVFELVERQCPRFYQPGQKLAGRVDGGWVRMYPQADIRLYVMDDGNVYYKYWRALNPVLIGTIDQLRAGSRVECSVRGRSGLPWEREI